MESDSRAKQSNFNILGKMRRAENSKGKKNVTIPDSRKLEKPAPAPAAAPSVITKFISQNSKLLLQAAGAAFVIILSLSMYNSSSTAIQNLVNADPEVLKSAFMGDQAYLFYCHRGGKDETVPSTFTELNKLKGSKMGFALLNCSQTLPSGKNLYDRFKLKQEIKPTIFATVPWGKPTQATKKELKDVASIKKFVEVTMAPKGVEVYSDKDMMKHCGFSALNKTAASDVRGETCFVLVKGTKYNKFNSDLEERIVRANPKIKIVTIDAVKKRLSFEDPESLPASTFEIKVHALRNTTHYMSMVNPLTWDYVSTFISQAISSPSYSFSGDSKIPIKMIKTGSSAFKNRSAPTTSPNSQPTAKQSKSQSQSGSSTNKKSPGGKSSESGNKDETLKTTEPVQETVAERFAREMRRRDEMERQSKEHLFENGEGDGSTESVAEEEAEEIEDDEEDENVIEL